MASKTNRRGALATRPAGGSRPPMGGDLQSYRSYIIRYGTPPPIKPKRK